jgi:hypothetical protein
VKIERAGAINRSPGYDRFDRGQSLQSIASSLKWIRWIQITSAVGIVLLLPSSQWAQDGHSCVESDGMRGKGPSPNAAYPNASDYISRKGQDAGREDGQTSDSALIIADTPIVRIYWVGKGLAERILQRLRNIYKPSVSTRISAVEGNRLLIWAGPEDQRQISKLLLFLEGSSCCNGFGTPAGCGPGDGRVDYPQSGIRQDGHLVLPQCRTWCAPRHLLGYRRGRRR